MLQSPRTRVPAIAPYLVHDPRNDRRVEDNGPEQKKNRDHECDEGNDDWCAVHNTAAKERGRSTAVGRLANDASG